MATVFFGIVAALKNVRVIRKLPWDDRYFLVSQFLTLALPVYWFCGRRHRVILAIHHNLEQAKESPLMKMLLRWSAHAGFVFLHFESDEALRDAALSAVADLPSITIPQPSLSALFWPEDGAQERDVTVAIAGLDRKEKTTSEILSICAEFVTRIDGRLAVGSAALGAGHSLPESAEVFSTEAQADYAKLLRSARAVVIANDPTRYRHRTSGVLTDAAVSGAWVLAPDCYVFEQQLATPKVVGETFRDLDDLEAILAKIPYLDPVAVAAASRAHRELRHPSNVARIFDRALERLTH